MKQGRIQFWLLTLITLLGGIISAPSGYATVKADIEIAEQLDRSPPVQLELLAAPKTQSFERSNKLEQYLISIVNADLASLIIYNKQNAHQFQLQVYKRCVFQHNLYSPSLFKHFNHSIDSVASKNA